MGDYTELVLGTVDDFYRIFERKRKKKKKPKEVLDLISEGGK